MPPAPTLSQDPVPPPSAPIWPGAGAQDSSGLLRHTPVYSHFQVRSIGCLNHQAGQAGQLRASPGAMPEAPSSLAQAGSFNYLSLGLLSLLLIWGCRPGLHRRAPPPPVARARGPRVLTSCRPQLK